MSRTPTFDRDGIVWAALTLVEQEGMSALTARAVAKRMRASTAPVYRHFASLDELAGAVMVAAREQLLASCRERYTGVVFLDVGLGVVLFAREHPRLYRALFLESDAFRELVRGFLDELTEHMRRDPRFTDLAREQREELLQHMWTYTHGLSALVVAGLVKDTSQAAIVEALKGVGAPVIAHALKERR